MLHTTLDQGLVVEASAPKLILGSNDVLFKRGFASHRHRKFLALTRLVVLLRTLKPILIHAAGNHRFAAMVFQAKESYKTTSNRIWRGKIVKSLWESILASNGRFLTSDSKGDLMEMTYAEAHADVMNDTSRGQEEMAQWMAVNKARFDAA